MKILITGVAGFIGYHLTRRLLELNQDQNLEVHGIDNLNDYYDVNLKLDRLKIISRFKNFYFYNFDISSLENLLNLETEFDCIINLAAQAGVRVNHDIHDRYLSSNILGFFNIISFANQKNIKKIIYASSSSVYSGLNKVINFEENLTLLNPNSIYAISKLTNEMMADVYFKKFNLSIIGLRFFTVYGPYGRPDMAYFLFTDSMVSGKPITLYNKGEMSRDMTYVEDIVSGICLSLNYINNSSNSYHEIFNLGNDHPVKTIDLLESISDWLKIKPNIIFQDSTNEVLHTHADLTKSSKILNYKPETSIDKGLGEFLNWHKRYFNY